MMKGRKRNFIMKVKSTMPLDEKLRITSQILSFIQGQPLGSVNLRLKLLSLLEEMLEPSVTSSMAAAPNGILSLPNMYAQGHSVSSSIPTGIPIGQNAL